MAGLIYSDKFSDAASNEIEDTYEHYVENRSYIIQVISSEISETKYKFKLSIMHKKKIIYIREVIRSCLNRKEFIGNVVGGVMYLMYDDIEEEKHLESKNAVFKKSTLFKIEEKPCEYEFYLQKVDQETNPFLAKINVTILVTSKTTQLFLAKKVSTSHPFYRNLVPALQFLLHP